MTNTIRINGASDDLIEFDGYINEEFMIASSDTWEGSLIAPDGTGLIVVAHYGVNGTWSAGIAPLGDQADSSQYALPDWNARLGSGTERYSTVLTLDVPTGTALTELT